jgi:complement component 1 Q subcomponent-binding protein
MAIFLHEYIRNKGKTEFIRWMGTVKSYIESK